MSLVKILLWILILCCNWDELVIHFLMLKFTQKAFNSFGHRSFLLLAYNMFTKKAVVKESIDSDYLQVMLQRFIYISDLHHVGSDLPEWQ